MGRIRGFDGLRALAAISVVITHLGLYRGLADNPIRTMIEGGPAVQLFFALSGFLITALLVREQQAFGRISIRYFFLRRAYRIFPLYLLFLAVVVVLEQSFGDVAGTEGLIYAATYTYNFIPWRFGEAQLGHLWSLAVEEHFYLVWPFVFLLLYPRYKRALVTGSLLVCLLSIYTRLRLPPEFAREYTSHLWSCFAGTSILFGCIAAVLVCDEEFRPRFAPFFRSRTALVLGLMLWANEFYLPHTVLCYQLRGVGFALLLGWIYQNQESPATRLLDVRPMRYLGMVSYGIYMYQGLFLTTGPERIAGRVWPLPPWIGLALLIVVVPLSYHFFEQRFIRVGKRYRQRAVIVPEPAQAESQHTTISAGSSAKPRYENA